MKKSSITLASALVLLAGLSFTAHAQNAPVNCDTAKEDLAHLQHEKKSTDERKVKGVMSILPIGLVINAASEAMSKDDPKEMQIDEYNKRIDQRIAEIKKACNM